MYWNLAGSVKVLVFRSPREDQFMLDHIGLS